MSDICRRDERDLVSALKHIGRALKRIEAVDGRIGDEPCAEPIGRCRKVLRDLYADIEEIILMECD